MLRTVIVEDEVVSQQALINYLLRFCPEVEIAGVASNIQEGKQIIDRENPNLVFLDVEMPNGNGFDLLDAMAEVDFQTIFVTAFSQYAIRAIQCSASNYLLKPIDIEELIAAVAKVKQQAAEKINPTSILLENIHISQKQKTKVVLPILDGLEIIRAEDIIHCEAQDNFTRFVLKSAESRLICRTLKYYQAILEPLGFLRIHKSHLINLDHVTKYLKGKGGYVGLSNGAELPVSSSKKNDLLEKLRP